MRAARLAFGVLRAGLAWLGLGVVLADDNPGPTLGAIAALVALIGGWASRSQDTPAPLRLGACLAPVIAARATAGTPAAFLAAACIALGWWVRLRFSDTVAVLAVIGAAVVATSHPSWRLLVAFSFVGAFAVGARPAFAGIRRARASLRNETAATSTFSPPIADGRPLATAKTGGNP